MTQRTEIIYIKTIILFKQVALSVASGGSTPARMTGTGIVKSPPSPPAASSATFVLTPAMTQQIVKQVGSHDTVRKLSFVFFCHLAECQLTW